MGFFGGPTDRGGDLFNFFVCPLSKLCVSDAHLRVREKHERLQCITVTSTAALFCMFWANSDQHTSTLHLKSLGILPHTLPHPGINQ